MEQVRRLVPVDPHAAEVVAQQVVEGISRQKGQAVRDPVNLVWVVIEVRLGPLPEVANCLGTLLVGPRPDAEADAVKCVRGVLLEDEGVMNAMWLAPACANLYIMRKASLQKVRMRPSSCTTKNTYPHGSMESSGNLIVLLKTRAASEDLGQPELAHGTLHVANLSLSWGRGLYPLRWLSSDTTHHVGMSESLGRTLLGLQVQSGRNRLGDARVQRRSPAGNDQVAVGLIAGRRAAITITSPGTDKGRMGVERRSHVVSV